LKQVALLLSKRNQFSYAARPGASARRAAHHAARRAARRRLLVVDYFAFAARPGASARRAARHAACRAARRRLLSKLTSSSPNMCVFSRIHHSQTFDQQQFPK
jgi:hypothetical protein